MQSLLDRINQLQTEKKHTVIAIDGNSTAGKSTLAACLMKTYSCSVISMDHFFLRPEQRTSERLLQPGGNIDYDRFIEQIVLPLRSKESFIYHPYDCKLDMPGAPIAINTDDPIIIIEGVYSMHPKFREHSIYDITVFLQINEDEQKRRLLMRNPHMYDRFIHEWVPMENKYFDFFQIAEKCNFIINYDEIQTNNEESGAPDDA